MLLIKYSGKYVKIYFNMKVTFVDTITLARLNQSEPNLHR